MTDESNEVECVFCGKVAGSVEEAIDAGWYPNFDDTNGDEIGGPTCERCSVEHLDIDDAGATLKPGHANPLD